MMDKPTTSNSEQQKRYACHLCERRFVRGKKLTLHLLKVHQLGKPNGSTRLGYTLRSDGLFRVQTELVPISSTPTTYHLPQTTCASFLINRLLNDREDGDQHPPLSPEFELDQWDDDDDDDNDDDDSQDDQTDVTDYTDLCSQRAVL